MNRNAREGRRPRKKQDAARYTPIITGELAALIAVINTELI